MISFWFAASLKTSSDKGESSIFTASHEIREIALIFISGMDDFGKNNMTFGNVLNIFFLARRGGDVHSTTSMKSWAFSTSGGSLHPSGQQDDVAIPSGHSP
jgi:hypothetical protein